MAERSGRADSAADDLRPRMRGEPGSVEDNGIVYIGRVFDTFVIAE